MEPSPSTIYQMMLSFQLDREYELMLLECGGPPVVFQRYEDEIGAAEAYRFLVEGDDA